MTMVSTITGGGESGSVGSVTSPLDVDNIRIEDNTVSSTNANGNITVDPNGTGVIDLQGPAQVTGTIPITTIVAGDEKAQIGGTNWNLGSDVHLRWYSDPDVPSGSADVGIDRSAAGILEVTNGSTGTGKIQAGNLRLDGNSIITTNANGDLALAPDGTGNVSVSGARQLLAPAGGASLPGLGFAATPGSGIDLPSAGALQVWLDGNFWYQFESTRFYCFRNDGLIVLGSSSDVGLGWAAAGVGRITQGVSGLGALRKGREVVARTADLTLALGDSGKLITNDGAAGQVIVTLPAATLTNGIGPEYYGCVRVAQNLRFQAGAGDVINTAAGASSAGGTLTSSTARSTVHLFVSAAGFWDTFTTGTWATA